jgi:hypothetical protein
MPHGEPVQPMVTYDGRIIIKPVDRDVNGEIIPDPSWIKLLQDLRNGKFENQEGD